ncbi:Hypothetical predicted protein, partial [Pelobates cultripes]
TWDLYVLSIQLVDCGGSCPVSLETFVTFGEIAHSHINTSSSEFAKRIYIVGLKVGMTHLGIIAAKSTTI